MEQKDDKLKWFATFFIFGFIAVFLEIIVSEYSSFQLFSRSIFDSKFPFVHDGVSLLVSLVVAFVVFVISMFLGRIIDEIISSILEFISVFIPESMDQLEVDERKESNL